MLQTNRQTKKVKTEDPPSCSMPCHTISYQLNQSIKSLINRRYDAIYNNHYCKIFVGLWVVVKSNKDVCVTASV